MINETGIRLFFQGKKGGEHTRVDEYRFDYQDSKLILGADASYMVNNDSKTVTVLPIDEGMAESEINKKLFTASLNQTMKDLGFLGKPYPFGSNCYGMAIETEEYFERYLNEDGEIEQTPLAPINETFLQALNQYSAIENRVFEIKEYELRQRGDLSIKVKFNYRDENFKQTFEFLLSWALTGGNYCTISRADTDDLPLVSFGEQVASSSFIHQSLLENFKATPEGDILEIAEILHSFVSAIHPLEKTLILPLFGTSLNFLVNIN